MTSYDHDDARLAETYHRISDSQFEGGRRLVERLGIETGERVLDVGCGTGRLARFIAECVGPGGAVVGIDPLPERIALARRDAGALRLDVGSAEDLGAFAEASFDAVCMSSVFHWIIDKAKALAEIRRVLRPGGRLGFTTSPKELYSLGTLPAVCASVLVGSPYVESLSRSGLDALSRHLTTTEIVTLLGEQQMELVELHVVRRTQIFPSGEGVVDFAQASSFGNFMSLVPEPLHRQLRTDLTSAFERIREPDGIRVRQHAGLFVAAKPAAG